MKRPLLAILLIMSVCGRISACGPFFPQVYLNGHDFIARPNIDMPAELVMLGKHFFPEDASYNYPKSNLTRQEAVSKDFLAACKLAHLDISLAQKLLKQLPEARKAAALGKKTELFHEYPSLKEFDLYIKGIAEMHAAPKKLPSSWNTLLSLPLKERRFRTSWTLYSAGNMFLKSNWPTAGKFYDKLRKYVRDGGNDSLGVARASYRTHYVYYGTDYPVEWLRAVLRDVSAGGSSELAMQHLRSYFKNKYPKLSLAQKQDIFNDAAAREPAILLISFLRNYNLPEREVAMLKDHKLACAEHLAWIAFKSGKEIECRKFLDITPKDSLIRLWLLAKFARREGKFAVASDLLCRWLRIYEKKQEESRLYFNNCSTDKKFNLTFARVVKGELGYTMTLNQDFSEALYTFMQADSWTDAACIAEQYMNNTQLMQFCSNHCPADSPNKLAGKLRHLLARKLLREYKFDDALKWFSGADAKSARDYVRLYRLGNDIGKSRNERAIALYNLGKLTRLSGAYILATELAPDYFITGCSFPYCGLNEEWYNRTYRQFIRPNIPIRLREHYRYKAVGFWNRAAILAEDGNIRVAALFQAFRLLRPQHPQEAEWFYKAITDCRPNPLAELAWKNSRHWKLNKKDMKIYKELYNSKALASKDEFAELFKKIPDKETTKTKNESSAVKEILKNIDLNP